MVAAYNTLSYVALAIWLAMTLYVFACILKNIVVPGEATDY